MTGKMKSIIPLLLATSILALTGGCASQQQEAKVQDNTQAIQEAEEARLRAEREAAEARAEAERAREEASRVREAFRDSLNK